MGFSRLGPLAGRAQCRDFTGHYLLNAVFNAKEWKIIATVVTLEPSSDFVQAITRRYQFEHRVEEIGNIYVNGLYINHAYLITANPSPAQVTPQPVAA